MESQLISFKTNSFPFYVRLPFHHQDLNHTLAAPHASTENTNGSLRPLMALW